MIGAMLTLDLEFDPAVERVTKALAKEGFGIISRIDLDRAFSEKLGKDFRRFTILGACNPGLAHNAVSANPEIGLLLPCNVTVEDGDEGAIVRLVDAGNMMAVGDLTHSPEIAELAEDAQARLSRVAADLREG